MSRAIVRTMELREIFAPGGPLARVAGEHYEQRPGQVAMAQAIDKQITSGGTLLVEAPTGTGKSLSYLIATIRRAVAERKKVVIVTANIALQEQLMQKDIPTVHAAMPEWVFAAALAKGIGNYLCLEKWQDAVVEQVRADRFEYAAWDLLDVWKQTTIAGDLSELTMELPPKVRLAVTNTADDCTGKTCDYYADCYGMQARRKIAAADVVVTNYHLFFADLAIKAGNESDSGILPSYDYVVLDEVHAAADIARDFFGWRMTVGQVRWAIRFLSPREQERILLEADQFFASLNVGSGKNGERIRPRITQPKEVDGSDLAKMLIDASNELALLSVNCDDSAKKAKLQKCMDRCVVHSIRLQMVTELVEAKKNVYFVEKPPGDRGHCSVGMKPLDVADILEKHLFDTEKVVIGTSATITAAGKFDYLINQIGAFTAETLAVPSPFDHRNAAVMIVPRDLPDPKTSLFADRVAEVVHETVLAAKGRTLALFTSYRVLEVTYQYLMGQRLPYLILKQGDRPRTQLIAEFRQDVSSVLLGTDSFWEGIDVRGESLSAVVMDRLPFEHPGDPVFEAICERNPRGWFMDEALPKSVIEFRQGFGRLIRSKTDRGAIVVCDRRIVDKPYGNRYLKSLPPGVELRRDIEWVRRIIEGN